MPAQTQQKTIIVSTTLPSPGVSYTAYDAIVAMSEPKADVNEALEQLRAQARKLGADAVVGVQMGISTFYGNTTFTKKERVVLLGTPIKYQSS